MQREKGSDGQESTEKSEPNGSAAADVPKGDTEDDVAEDQTGKLSLDDALEVAIAGTKEEVKTDEKPRGSGTDRNAEKAEQNRASAKPARDGASKGRGATDSRDRGASGAGGLEAPAGWNTEEKADFYASSRVAQEAALRLEKSRGRTIEEIRLGKEQLAREREEVSWARDIVKEITPFLKSNGRGEKEPTHAQVIKALKVVNEIDANTKGAVAEILRARKIPVPKELEDAGVTTDFDEKIVPLQNQLKEVQTELAERKRAEQAQALGTSWQAFESTKNAAGSPKYPGVGNDESGIRMASNIGSLVCNTTDLSKQFIANVAARIPNLTYEKLYEQAYLYLGGKVDDSETPTRTQDTQKHVMRSSKAASSVPGRTAVPNESRVRKFAKLEDAQKAALEDLRESE